MKCKAPGNTQPILAQKFDVKPRIFSGMRK